MSFNEVNQSSGELGQIAGSQVATIYADAPLGAIVPYGGDTAPTGYLLCDGSAVSRTTYSDLYAVIGTKYGEGDGSTTFNLPDGQAGAELYPAADVGSGIAGSVYIIKAIKTALPSDFQAEIDDIKANYVRYNSENDYLYVGDTPWKKAYLGGIIYDGADHVPFTTSVGTDAAYTMVRTVDKIDISGFGNAHVTFNKQNSSSTIIIGFWDGETYASGLPDINIKIYSNAASFNGTKSLDISSYSGSYYFIAMYSNMPAYASTVHSETITDTNIDMVFNWYTSQYPDRTLITKAYIGE